MNLLCIFISTLKSVVCRLKSTLEWNIRIKNKYRFLTKYARMSKPFENFTIIHDTRYRNSRCIDLGIGIKAGQPYSYSG